MEVNDEMDRGVKRSKLFTLPGIIPAKLKHFLPLLYYVPGLINPCPSHHLSPGPSNFKVQIKAHGNIQLNPAP